MEQVEHKESRVFEDRLTYLENIAAECLEEMPTECTPEELELDDNAWGAWQEYKETTNYIDALRQEEEYGRPHQ